MQWNQRSLFIFVIAKVSLLLLKRFRKQNSEKSLLLLPRLLLILSSTHKCTHIKKIIKFWSLYHLQWLQAVTSKKEKAYLLQDMNVAYGACLVHMSIEREDSSLIWIFFLIKKHPCDNIFWWHYFHTSPQVLKASLSVLRWKLLIQWNPFLTTSRIATTVAITTDLQIPVYSFLWVM